VTAVPIVSGMRLGYALERITAMHVHGHAWTHLDALCHVFWDGRMYNGRPAELVSAARGAEALPVTVAKQGIVTRGVLLDVAAARGVAWLEPGDTVWPADLEAAERKQRVSVEPGDAVFLRTGYGRFRRERRDDVPADRIVEPGWHAAAMPWLHARDVALIGCDAANDAQPSRYPAIGLPVHVIGLVAMGLWLIDNCDLEAVAETATRLRRWSFQLSVCPLPLNGLTSSPVNPIATF
jgi:kynurenine formamidase